MIAKPIVRMIALLTLLGMEPAGAAEPSPRAAGGASGGQARDSAGPCLPFAWDVVQEPSPWWSGDHENRTFDCGFRQVVIDGELWFMCVKWQDLYAGKCRVLRYRGPDLDHLVRQPDGFADLSGAHGGGFLGVGMWWDEPTRTLYTLMHTECEPLGEQGWCTKKTRMAMSTDRNSLASNPYCALPREGRGKGDGRAYGGGHGCNSLASNPYCALPRERV